jgi:hypothetical protein
MAPRGVTGTTTAWLFTRGHESVRLEAHHVPGGGLRLLINGPGKHRESVAFADAAALIAKQAEYERYLVSRGFLLEQFTSERRKWPR